MPTRTKQRETQPTPGPPTRASQLNRLSAVSPRAPVPQEEAWHTPTMLCGSGSFASPVEAPGSGYSVHGNDLFDLADATGDARRGANSGLAAAPSLAASPAGSPPAQQQTQELHHPATPLDGYWVATNEAFLPEQATHGQELLLEGRTDKAPLLGMSIDCGRIPTSLLPNDVQSGLELPVHLQASAPLFTSPLKTCLLMPPGSASASCGPQLGSSSSGQLHHDASGETASHRFSSSSSAADSASNFYRRRWGRAVSGEPTRRLQRHPCIWHLPFAIW